MGRKQRISYVPVEVMDAPMQEEMERCQREGTPRPESSAVRAHVPAWFCAFASSWLAVFREGPATMPRQGVVPGVRIPSESVHRF